NKKGPVEDGAKVLKKTAAYFLLTAEEPSLTGTVGSAAGFSTFPLIVRTLVGVFALEVMVTVLVKGPTRLVSYFTLMELFAPGAIGSRGQVGTVHPQEPLALVMIRGSLPVLTNTNSR